MALFGTPSPPPNRMDELKRILQKDPTSRQFLGLAEEYRRHGKLRDAIITLERGLQLHGTSVAAHVALGRTYQQLDRLEDATRAYINALRLDRENLVAIRQLVEVHLAKGDKVEAIKKLKLYRGLKPGDKDVNELIAQIEAETPPVKDAGSSGVKPRPSSSAASPVPISASSARRAAARARGEPPTADQLLEKALSRPRSSSELSPEELYGSTPLLHRMWEEEAGGDAPESAASAAAEPRSFEAERPPEPPSPPRPASREIRALSFEYEVPVLSGPAEAPPRPPPRVPPAVPPAPAPAAAAAPEMEPAPFDDVPASAPAPGPDFFEAPGGPAATSSPADVPVLSAPSFDEPPPADAFEDPPTQPLFFEPPAIERRQARVVSREIEPPPVPLEMPEPEPPAAAPAPPSTGKRKGRARLRALAGRFPTRSSASVDDLRGCLQSLVAKAAGIRAAVLTDMQGLPVLTVGRAGERSDAQATEILVAEMASFLKNVRRTRDEVGEGTLTSLTLVGEYGAAVVSRVSHDYSLILQVDPQAALGEIRYEAARTAGTLRSAVR